MNKWTKILVFTWLLVLLSACSATEFFIKREITGMERKIARELKGLAKFNAEQKVEVEKLAALTARWGREQRLPIMSGYLRAAANDLQTAGHLDLARWNDFAIFMEDPLALASAPGVVDAYAEVAYSMDREQVLQMEQKLNDDFQEWREQEAKQTNKKTTKRTLSGIGWVLRAAGASLDAEQKQQIASKLQQRRPDFEQDYAQASSAANNIIQLMQRDDFNQAEFTAEFESIWLESAKGSNTTDPETWQHNVNVGYDLIALVTAGLSIEERNQLAEVLLDYATLFDELSLIN